MSAVLAERETENMRVYCSVSTSGPIMVALVLISMEILQEQKPWGKNGGIINTSLLRAFHSIGIQQQQGRGE